MTGRHRHASDGAGRQDAGQGLLWQFLAASRDAIVVQDMGARIEWLNPAFERLYGWSLAELRGRRAQDVLLAPELRPAPAEIVCFRDDPGGALFDRDHLGRHMRRDGSTLWVRQSFALLDPGAAPADRRVIVTCRDATGEVGTERALRQAQADLGRAADHDDLTGLANRRWLAAHLATPQMRARIARGDLGVLALDIDRFKDINDTLGPEAGDRTLCHVAGVLARAALPGDLVCRTGGDEFAMLCTIGGDAAAILDRAAEVQRALGAPLAWQGQRIRIAASIGTCAAGAEATSGAQIVQGAEVALHDAKRRGRGRIVPYTGDLGRAQRARQTLARDLREAIIDNQFEIHLQPQLALDDDRICGCEALIRWRHPARGLLPPALFLDAAAGLGLLADIDYRSMTMALDALVALDAAGFGDLSMSINVSSAILADLNYPGLLDWALQARRLRPDRICIEVLETTMIEGADADVLGAVARLKHLGVRVALDDFGTGHAGLAHMSRLTVDAIKLDRSMIARLDDDPRNRVIVRAIIRLCRLLDISVVAEGVETATQRDLLRRAGCPVIQGFGLARPMPPADLIDWLRARTSAPPALGHAR